MLIPQELQLSRYTLLNCITIKICSFAYKILYSIISDKLLLYM